MSEKEKDTGRQVMLVAATVAAIYVSIFAGLYFNFDRDFSNFIGIGDTYGDPAQLPDDVCYFKNSTGYDGQFYYRLALDPFTRETTGFGITLDYNGYRQQRIMYPLLARAAALGRREWVPAGMVLVNLAALCALGLLAAKLAAELGRQPYLGLAFALYPGFYFGLRCDLVEPLAACFLLAYLLFMKKERWTAAAVAAVLAVLTRETTILVFFGVFVERLVAAARGGDKAGCAVRAQVAPGAAFLAMQAAMYLNWGTLPFLEAKGNIGAPFAGFVKYLQWHIAEADVFTIFNHLEIAGLVMFAAGVMWICARNRFSRPLQFTWLLYFAVAISMTNYVWVDDLAYLRTLTTFVFTGFYVIMQNRSYVAERIAFAYTTTTFFLLVKYYFTADAVFFR